MKYGVREICNVFVKAKVDGQMVGNKPYSAGQPVCHFDSLKTSTMEGAATTVYATGGRGNPRLMSWDGERTLTFTMEDALISETGIALLTGAGLINAEDNAPLYQHATLTGVCKEAGKITLNDSKDIIDMFTKDDASDYPVYVAALDSEGSVTSGFTAITGSYDKDKGVITVSTGSVTVGTAYLIDCYQKKTTGLCQIDIEPGKFGGNYYFEAETLFRAGNGKDVAAEFIIPNGKIQSNFTFSMAASGDPSTFTFTVDAFPGVTKSDPTKKVLASIQMATSVDATTEATYPNTTPSDGQDDD